MDLKYIPVSISPIDADMVTSQEAITKFANRILETVKTVFNDGGSFRPTFFIMGYRDLQPIVLIYAPPHFASEADKSLAESIAKALAEQIKAFGIIFAYESWALDLRASDKEEVHSIMKEWRGRLEEHPDRKELMWVHLEHRAIGFKAWGAEIVRKDPEKPTIDKFKEEAGAALSQVTGKFTAFLPTPPDTTLN